MRWQVGGSEAEVTPRNQTEKRLRSSESLHVMVAAAMATEQRITLLSKG